MRLAPTIDRLDSIRHRPCRMDTHPPILSYLREQTGPDFGDTYAHRAYMKYDTYCPSHEHWLPN